MKKLILLLSIFLISSGLLFAQNHEKSDRKAKIIEKQLKKKEREERDAREFAHLIEMAQDTSWVLEAYSINDKYGNRIQVNPTLNFVSILDDEAIIQFGSDGNIGYNGLGGITLKGDVDKYKVSERNMSITINALVSGAGMGTVDLSARISSDGSARVTVSDNWGQRITYSGQFVPYEISGTYTGSPTL